MYIHSWVYLIRYVFHFVQSKAVLLGAEHKIQMWKKESEKWDEEVKKNEEAIKQFKEEKKREQYEGELWVILCSSVNTADWLQIRLGQFATTPHALVGVATGCALDSGWWMYIVLRIRTLTYWIVCDFQTSF